MYATSSSDSESEFEFELRSSRREDDVVRSLLDDGFEKSGRGGDGCRGMNVLDGPGMSWFRGISDFNVSPGYS